MVGFIILLSLETSLELECLLSLKADCLRNPSNGYVEIGYYKRRSRGSESKRNCASGTEPAAHRVVSEAECDGPPRPILLIGPADDADRLMNLAVAFGRKEEAALAGTEQRGRMDVATVLEVLDQGRACVLDLLPGKNRCVRARHLQAPVATGMRGSLPCPYSAGSCSRRFDRQETTPLSDRFSLHDRTSIRSGRTAIQSVPML